MPHHPRRRRTAPYWVRQLPDQALHGLTGKLARVEQSSSDPFSARQDWLLTACIAELGWRALSDQQHGITPCSCQWCCAPFPDRYEGESGHDGA